MDLKLQDRLCLVTGASSGIGRATAVVLASEGARVVATARSLAALDGLADEFRASGCDEPLRLVADFARPGAPDRLVDEVLDRVGAVDVLVNNAGGSRPMADPDDAAVWEEALRVNFDAPRRLGERLIPAMAERGWGRVVSVTGSIVAKALTAAAPPKAALESWSKATAATYAARGVTVNCVAPGRIDSAQIRDRLHPTEASRQDYIARNIPAGRFGEAREAAALITFLAAGAASYITGTTIPIDGGGLRYAF